MTFDHIRQLRNFSAKVFRESTITGETRRQVSDRLENEALQVPGFQFTDIAGHRWSHKSYFEMLARTELMNGARDSYEQECAEQGYNIMLLSVSGHCCDACAKYEGQYFSIGPNKYGLPTKDDLEAEGVFHPNCTHSYSAVPDYIIEREFGKKDQKNQTVPNSRSNTEPEKLESSSLPKSMYASKLPQSAPAKHPVPLKKQYNQAEQITSPPTPQIEFTPATNIKDAAKFTEQNLGENVNWDGIPLETVNAINRELMLLKSEFPILEDKFKVIGKNGIWKDNVLGHAGDQLIEFNPKYASIDAMRQVFENEKSNRSLFQIYLAKWKSLPGHEAEKAFRDAQRFLRFSRNNVLISPEKAVQACTTHECGHTILLRRAYKEQNDAGFLLRQNKKTRGSERVYNLALNETPTMKLVKETYQKAKKDETIYKISEYASKNPKEFFSECLVMYRFEKSELPDYIIDMIERIAK